MTLIMKLGASSDNSMLRLFGVVTPDLLGIAEASASLSLTPPGFWRAKFGFPYTYSTMASTSGDGDGLLASGGEI